MFKKRMSGFTLIELLVVIAIIGILAGLLIKLCRFAGHLDRLGQFGKVFFLDRRQTDGCPPTIDILKIMPGEARQRHHADIGLLAILTGNAERGDPHLPRSGFLPAVRQFPLKPGQRSSDVRVAGWHRAGSVRMPRRHHPGIHLRLRLRLFLGNPINLDIILTAPGQHRGQNQESPSRGRWVPANVRQRIHTIHLRALYRKRKPLFTVWQKRVRCLRPFLQRLS